MTNPWEASSWREEREATTWHVPAFVLKVLKSFSKSVRVDQGKSGKRVVRIKYWEKIAIWRVVQKK
jgi:hypothetical protein